MVQVFIQYNCIPHYREPLFETLCAQDDPKFTIICDDNSDTPYLKIISSDSSNIRQLKARTFTFRLLKMPEFYWQPNSIKMFIVDQPDAMIVLSNPYSLTAWVILVLGKILGKPVILWGHGLLSNETGPKWWIRRSFYKLASGHLLYGHYAKKLLIDKGFTQNNLFVVYNSLNYLHQNQIFHNINKADQLKFKKTLDVKRNERLVVFTGRLQPIKKLDLLVKALAILSNKKIRVHCALVGEGSQKQHLKELATRTGVSSLVHFLGEHYEEEYLGLVYKSSDLCVIPSGAGLTIMHSLVFGTPVLISNNTEKQFPEWEAVIDNKTGFFFSDENVEDMAEKIQQIVFNKNTKSKMATSCRAIIQEKYNPAIQAQVFNKAIEYFKLKGPYS